MYDSTEKKFVQSPYPNNSPTELEKTPSRPSTIHQDETHDTEIPNENWSNVKMEDEGAQNVGSQCAIDVEMIDEESQV